MMDLPQPPQDTELRNIIDKLAQFVARNGPEFEQMTKNKQKGNPKFQFLYGGEFFNYYQYKVTTEQAILKQQGIIQETTPNNWNSPPRIMHNNNNNNNNNNSGEIEQIVLQQDNLREQIKQSEQNLSAQHTVLLQQQQVQTEVVLAKCVINELQKEAEECDINLQDIYNILQPIIDSCTKDSISNGKSWFLQHATNDQQAYCIVHCLLYKVIESTTFPQKLHVIYLVNDLLHHCARKNANNLKESLESVVVPMFCNTHIIATDEQRIKLEKLLKLWESKANYLDSNTVDKMRNPIQSYQDYQSEQMAKYTNEITNLTQQTKVTYDRYQAQHQAFVCHAMQQIMDLQQQKQALEQQTIPQPPPTVSSQQQQVQQQQQSSTIMHNTNIIPLETIQASLQQTIQNLSQQNQNNNNNSNNQTFPSTSNLNPPNPTLITNDFITTIPPPNLNNLNQPPPLQTIPNMEQHHHHHNQPPPPPPPTSTTLNHLNPNNNNNNNNNSNNNGLDNITFSQPPPGFFQPPPGIFPDFSKPPPGFLPNPEPTITTTTTITTTATTIMEELMPTAPYYDLPAGLIVPLIKLEDTSYKPLDPKDIRLPPPAPPSEHLLAAVEAFYSLPSHERPRDSEGWEKLGLYEYYKAKNNAKKEKEDMIAAGLREQSKSPSPVYIPIEKEPLPPKRRYMSKSPSPPPAATVTSLRIKNRSKSRSNTRSRSRSRSRSPPPPLPTPTITTSTNKSSTRRSSKHSRRSRRRSISRSSSRSPIRRSPSPIAPSFSSSNYIRNNDRQELDSSNKGHQMLRKMGWGGSGLGVKEQGIDTPITGGDVRDKQDQFRGVGCNLNDPYENFRKNKGAAFITRMKARAEERANESKFLDY